MNTSLKIILGLTIFGVAVSSYAMLHNADLAAGEFCSIGKLFDCGEVNKGEYSTFLGIPVALLGVLFYLTAFAMVVLKLVGKFNRFWEVMFYLAAMGVLFTLYLTYLEAFVIESYCLVCLTSFAIVLGIFAIAFKIHGKE